MLRRRPCWGMLLKKWWIQMKQKTWIRGSGGAKGRGYRNGGANGNVRTGY